MFPQLFGKYVLERELGRGGMARVFEATLRGASGFRKKLVVKQILPEFSADPAFVRRFVEEAKTAVELNHPGIVPVYELGVESGVYFLSMEYCVGVSLAALLVEGGPLDDDLVAYLGAELGGALDHAHRRGVVHRDVTPHNVLIDEEGAVRLIDFGIAARVATPEFEPSGTERGGSIGASEIFGSPGYMPPEQVRGEPLTPAVDTFALGALLLEASTGVAPFRRSTEEESLRAVAQPPTETSLPPPGPLRECLLLTVRTAAGERPDPIENVARELRRLIRDRDTGDLARALGERVRRARKHAMHPPPERSHTPARASSTAPLADSSESRTFATRRLPDAPNEPSPTNRATAAAAPGPTRGLDEAPDDAPHEATHETAPESPRQKRTPNERGPSRARALTMVLVLSAGVAALAPWGLRRAPPSSEVTHRSDDASQQAGRVPSVPALPPKARPSEEPTPPTVAASGQLSPGDEGPARLLPPDSTTPRTSAPIARSAASAGRLVSPVPATGQVALTAAPQAEVEIAGRRLSTPVEALRLPTGTYRATFRSPTWEGPVSTEVSVAAERPTRIHADFTTEPPRVLVR